jgi:hypothetical protein
LPHPEQRGSRQFGRTWATRAPPVASSPTTFRPEIPISFRINVVERTLVASQPEHGSDWSSGHPAATLAPHLRFRVGWISNAQLRFRADRPAQVRFVRFVWQHPFTSRGRAAYARFGRRFGVRSAAVTRAPLMGRLAGRPPAGALLRAAPQPARGHRRKGQESQICGPDPLHVRHGCAVEVLEPRELVTDAGSYGARTQTTAVASR